MSPSANQAGPGVALSTSGLTKRYGDVVALDRVGLRVARGEIYGFLGRNGAGKSTTIRLILGMMRPSSGHAEIFGRTVRADSAMWRRVGHLVDSATGYPELTVHENLEIARQLQGVSDGGAVGRAIERLGLGGYADRRVRMLSLGNLQRLGLARALVHEPELLVLDEPTNGLDPGGVVEVRELLRDLVRDRGVTVFMSSHVLTEVERLCTRIGIVHRGRLVEELGGNELEARRDERLEVSVRDVPGAERVLRRAGFAPISAIGSGAVRLQLRESRAIGEPDEVARLLVEAGLPPIHLAVAQEELEDHFLRLTSDPADQG
jgi:ABC-2 type transport system ATP-binding protein